MSNVEPLSNRRPSSTDELAIGGLRRSLTELIRDWQPPVARREFWAVQALVVLIAGTHGVLELNRAALHGALAFLPTSLFLVPVVYAALNFGLRGSLPTALWCAVLTLPNAFLLHHGGEQLGELWQIGVVIAIAVFVGQRVDREQRARLDAEDRERARRASEEKYRGIFDHVAEPILLLDSEGRIEEANRAAGTLFSATATGLTGRHVSGVIAIDLPSEIARGAGARPVRRLDVSKRGRPAWVEPVLLPVVDPSGATRIQLMLRDVTLQHERQQELEAYARQSTTAREEERGRIARDLHDGPVQTLVLLWRQLDAIGTLDDAERTAHLAAAQRTAQEAADELRRVSRDLRPSILHDLGLATALRAEVTSFTRRSGIAARFLAAGLERRLGSDRELAILRILEEALRNIEQHAHARHVVVRLHFQPTRVRLVVSDDGSGMPDLGASELVAAGKLGLIGMKERARLVDATLSIRSGPRGGTVVAVAITC